MRNARFALLFVLMGVAFLSGCLFTPTPEAAIYATPNAGPPSFVAGGLFVMFSSNGAIKTIDFGDGSPLTIAWRSHVYAKVGEYTAIATVDLNGRDYVVSTTIVVENDPCLVGPPFVLIQQLTNRARVIVDGRKQQHGCLGGGTAEDYGAQARNGEELVYDWVITLYYVDNRAPLKVYGEGAPGQSLELVAWHVGSPYKVIPDSLPVLEIDGAWLPPGYSTMDVCPIEDPWADPPLPGNGLAFAVAEIVMTVTNQFGSTGSSTTYLDVYENAGCN